MARCLLGRLVDMRVGHGIKRDRRPTWIHDIYLLTIYFDVMACLLTFIFDIMAFYSYFLASWRTFWGFVKLLTSWRSYDVLIDVMTYFLISWCTFCRHNLLLISWFPYFWHHDVHVDDTMYILTSWCIIDVITYFKTFPAPWHTGHTFLTLLFIFVISESMSTKMWKSHKRR